MLAFLNLLLHPKRLLGIACGVFCVFWLLNGNEILSRTSQRLESKVIADFKRDHPKSADWLAAQQDRSGQFSTAVAIESLQGHTLNPEALRQSVEVRARLTSLYLNDPASDESMLWSHGTALDMMSRLPEEADAYVSELEAAKADHDYWSLVRNDPVALSSELLKSNLALRKDYQANQAWYLAMLEVLVAMIQITPDPDADEQDAAFIQLDDLLEVASDGQPHLRQLVPRPSESPLEACIYYETFRQFGQVISMAAKQGVPPKQAAEVIILNRDALLRDAEEASGAKVQDPVAVATQLVTLYRNRPSVWAAAQRDGYVLAFDQLTPGQSQSVLEKHVNLGVASLIVTQYPDAATQAAAIVDRYGELGVAVLAQYAGSETFDSLLQDARVDRRIAMVAVLHSDVGLEAVLRDPAYIEKWIDEAGEPFEEQWWVNVPLVGGIAKVAANQATGVPSDWNEIGWAAWDVADIGLMIASFGASKVLMESAKQTAKQTGKSAAKKMSTTGARRVGAAQAQPSAINRLTSFAATSPAAAPIRWTARTTIHVAGSVKTMGDRVVQTSHRMLQTANRIPPGARMWAARGMLGASLFVRGPERIRALITSANNYATQAVSSAIEALPQALAGAIEKIKQAASEAASGRSSMLLNLFVIAISALLALSLLLDIGPRLSFSGFGTHEGSRKQNRPSS